VGKKLKMFKLKTLNKKNINPNLFNFLPTVQGRLHGAPHKRWRKNTIWKRRWGRFLQELGGDMQTPVHHH